MIDAKKERCLICGSLAVLDEEGECSECAAATAFPTDGYFGGTNLDYRINCAESEGLLFDGEFFV
jgi:hypothetical protein